MIPVLLRTYRHRTGDMRRKTILFRVPLVYAACLLINGTALGRATVALARDTTVGNWTPIESMRYIWRKNDPAYLLTVEENSAGRESPRLRIQDPHGSNLTIALDGGVVPIADGLLDNDALIADSLIKSKYIYMSPKLRNARGEPMLIIFGWAYGSAPGSIRIVALNSHGTPQILFSAQTFLLTRTVTRHNGRNLEIIGVRSMTQKSGCLETYNPYIVYRLSLHRGTAFTYSEESSRKYNDEHYFRWAGPKATERIAIVLCKRGYGRVLPWTEAERLYNH